MRKNFIQQWEIIIFSRSALPLATEGTQEFLGVIISRSALPLLQSEATKRILSNCFQEKRNEYA